MKEVLETTYSCALCIIVLCVTIFIIIKTVSEAINLLDDIKSHYYWKRKSRK